MAPIFEEPPEIDLKAQVKATPQLIAPEPGKYPASSVYQNALHYMISIIEGHHANDAA